MKFAEAFGDVEVWLGRAGRSPGGVKPALLRAFNPEEVQTPDLAGMESGGEALHRYRHFRRPDAGFRISTIVMESASYR